MTIDEHYQDSRGFSKLSWFFIALMFAGTICFLLFNLIGSTLDENGMLQEPFFLLPLGYLLVAAGMIGLAIRLTISLFRHSRGKG